MNWKINLFRKNNNQPKIKKSKTREWVDAIIFALVVSTAVRGLLFSAYAIPSGSMEGTQLPGDYLFVSKISYGPRIAITPIAFPFTEPVVGGGKPTGTVYNCPTCACQGYHRPQKAILWFLISPMRLGLNIISRLMSELL